MSERERFERAPDGIVPLVGSRMWQGVDEGDEPVFLPLTNGSRDWVGAARGWVTASCSLPDELELGPIAHLTPGEYCVCGFYAMKELDRELLITASMAARVSATMRNEDRFVLGRVELAGKVIEHRLGYRAERARIVELIPLGRDQRAVEAIARRAGIGVGKRVKVPRTSIIRNRVRLLRLSRAASRAVEQRLGPSERNQDGV